MNRKTESHITTHLEVHFIFCCCFYPLMSVVSELMETAIVLLDSGNSLRMLFGAATECISGDGTMPAWTVT